MTSRDRNRIALQADLLGAAVLGVGNIVVMGGDREAQPEAPRRPPGRRRPESQGGRERIGLIRP